MLGITPITNGSNVVQPWGKQVYRVLNAWLRNIDNETHFWKLEKGFWIATFV